VAMTMAGAEFEVTMNFSTNGPHQDETRW